MALVRSFRKFALLTTFLVYLVIFAGGLVRVSGAGLGCPDWPKCFGRWIPPTSVEQLPPDMHPAQFNITLAWIEYINRLVGVIVGIMIATVAIWALVKFRNNKRILLASIGAAILVAFQGWHGGVVVESLLKQSLVSIHYLLALLVAGMMIFVSVQSHYLEADEIQIPVAPKDIRWWAWLLLLLGFVQIFLGTQVRSTVENLASDFPLLSGSERLAKVGLLNHVHLALGLTVAAFSWVFSFWVRRNRQAITPLIKKGAVIAVILALVQLLLGFGFILLGLSPLVELFHLCVASLIIGTLFMILSATFGQKEK